MAEDIKEMMAGSKGSAWEGTDPQDHGFGGSSPEELSQTHEADHQTYDLTEQASEEDVDLGFGDSDQNDAQVNKLGTGAAD